MGYLLRLDPDLGRHLSEREAAAARRYARVELRSLAAGHWQPASDPVNERPLYGLVILEGALSRRIQVGRRHTAELLGAGDVVCPDVPDVDPHALVPQVATWRALAPVRMMVIDDELASGLAGLRGVLGELQRRSVVRSRDLALRLALQGERDLEPRLELLLWHLADRWAIRRGGSVVFAIPLMVWLLADFAGADRSATSRALARLRARRLLARQEDGTVVLLGTPPA